MRKTTLLLLASMTLAVLLSCTTAVLMAAQGVAQTTTETVTLEAVMNSVRNGLGMRETEITREPSRL